MNWEVMILDGPDDHLVRTMVIKAGNWYEALRRCLDKSGNGGKLISSIHCNINDDQSIKVTDFVTQKNYQVRCLEPLAAAAAHTPSVTVVNPQVIESRDPRKNRNYQCDINHDVFQTRDEKPSEPMGVYYRERLIALRGNPELDTAKRLARAAYVKLRRDSDRGQHKLYINVQVFDHQFDTEPKRPALAALSWREWLDPEPSIHSPINGDNDLAFRSPVAHSAPVKITERTVTKTKEPPKEASSETVRESSPTLPVDDRIVDAFERMQELYAIRDHDTAAAFTLGLAREFVQCDAGACMLITPGKEELYVAAANGEMAEKLDGRRFSLADGIVGFATRNGAVLTLTEPAGDSRFAEENDHIEDFEIRNLTCVPLQHEGRTVGAIELWNSPEHTGFSSDEVNIIAYIAGSLAEYIVTHLPSREADFHDGEFHPEKPKRPSLISYLPLPFTGKNGR